MCAEKARCVLVPPRCARAVTVRRRGLLLHRHNDPLTPGWRGIGIWGRRGARWREGIWRVIVLDCLMHAVPHKRARQGSAGLTKSQRWRMRNVGPHALTLRFSVETDWNHRRGNINECHREMPSYPKFLEVVENPGGTRGVIDRIELICVRSRFFK